MAHVIQTDALVQEGVISSEQGAIIASRSRQVMVSLAINTVLCFGIIAAAAGFIGLLGDALAVAIVGGVFLAVGTMILTKTTDVYSMFGNASALIGAGMLVGGASIKILEALGEGSGGMFLAILGLGLAVFTAFIHRKGREHTGFLTGSILLMVGAMHLGGLYLWAADAELSGLAASATHLYVAAAMIALGIFIDVRLITALAIVPFAQMLDTGTFYWGAMYAFYSPETTLSILQLGIAMAICVVLASVLSDRYRRHTHMFGIMAFIVANMCFLVGSLWGDIVGQNIWGPGSSSWRYDGTREEYNSAMELFEASTWVIHEHVYSIVWAVLLIAAAFWSAYTNRRGIFNAAITFGAIHAYTQAFETFYDEPLAYVIGGLAAIPVAWGLWRLNNQFEARNKIAA
ncbi:hypothetical protein Q4555_08390 [Octadecabacter sp. 1_MG-2023]|uniref:hypothetical protein n=1 Tax=unclassified Octadecabacter TaxID=196158 RepID=UPI001C0891F2|nr:MULTISPECIES: hypothetical protein [unclassified Octadecabacter]MBU2992557.1 hypothetical protein [Octadecabacter sp. B2R22]MDO6734686.1 hypothetical protein [Octadecabacter sp. 1_MG-2023]